MAHLYPALMTFLLTTHAADPVVAEDEPQLSDPGWRGAKAALRHLREQEEERAAVVPATVCFRRIGDGVQLYEVEVEDDDEVTRPIPGAYGEELTDAALELPDEARFDAYLVRPIDQCEHPDSGT